jgi:uncharacterized damage-inducible protein DinB
MSAEVHRLIDQLRRAHDGDPWHGSPVVAILAGVTAAQAATAPPNGAHSIWAIVLHMTAWRREVAARASGAPAGEPAAGDWPGVPEPTAEGWRKAIEDLAAAHREVVEAASRLTDAEVFEPTIDRRNRPLGTGVTRYELLHGLVQHDAYHAGQIGILRRVLGF